MADEGILKRKRGSVKARLTSFKKYLTSIQGEIEISANLQDTKTIELEQRILKVEQLLHEYEEIQNELDCIVEDVNAEFIERENFEKEYFEYISLAKQILNNHKVLGECVSDEGSVHSKLSVKSNKNQMLESVKLPTIQLPSFNGNFETWLEFRDTFESLINMNCSISEIQKFHYLRASLVESAAQVISSIEFTSENYAVAWEVVRKRYDNSRLLVDNHVKALFNLEVMQKESSQKIRKLIDSINKHLRSLSQLNQPTEHWDTLIIHLIATKLDNRTARQWEEFKTKREVPNLEDLKVFLKGRADILESIEQNQIDKRPFKKETSTRGFFSSTSTCAFCKKEHLIYKCDDFKNLSVSDRISKAKALKLCLNCLKVGHHYSSCRLGPCYKCKLKHNTLLHNQTSANSNQAPKQTTATNCDDSSTVNKEQQVALNSFFPLSHILLSTACVKIYDNSGTLHTARALLDCGSQSSFITENLCSKLRLNTKKINVEVSGLNQATSISNKRCEIDLYSNHDEFQTKITSLVIKTITDEIPSVKINRFNLKIPSHVVLADPNFDKPNKIDILIGADVFWTLICNEQIKIGPHKPILQKTKLGWIISGPVSNIPIARTLCNFSKQSDVQDQLAKFWELEECPREVIRSPEENACEEHFLRTTRRADGGRFIVSLPFKDSIEKLGKSKFRAEKCLLSLEQRLQSNDYLKKMYTTFLTEYESLGHMSKISDKNLNTNISYYMPHHGVMREESETTKLRVVFNASSPSTTGNSLNSLQMTGPTIQEDLLSIILNFRKYSVVISADVTKMYRQILIEPEQRALQRILWRSNSSKPIDTYELNTVTYGTTAASFLAIRCLFQLAAECQEELPEIATIIRKHMYVDDLLYSCETNQTAAQVAEQITQVLNRGGFELRKWCSNKPEAIKHVVNLDTNSKYHDFGENQTKTLGLRWSCDSDEIFYKVNPNLENDKVTKRLILSCTAQIFDPLGLLSPVIIVAKILLRKLWSEKLAWDDIVTSDIKILWQKFNRDLEKLNELKIKRQVICENPSQIELHAFSDASELAYGACVYIRSITQNGEIFVNLLCAKSKVAPLKTLTIPKLELCGGLVLSKLFDKVKTCLGVEFSRTVFWTDSTILLGWLRTSPSLLKTFVNNRIAEIQTKTDPNNWRHISSKDNPADILSRGVGATEINDLDLWWKGPVWLSKTEEYWPQFVSVVENITLPELRIQTKTFRIAAKINFPFEKFSSLLRLKRTVAYMLRFIYNCKNKNLRKTGPLSIDEINNAFMTLIRIVQIQCFNDEYNSLINTESINLKSSILSANPFLDSNKIIRVGGRLHNSNFPFEKKHPILLPSKHHLVKLIFEYKHKILLHPGPQQLLADIRQEFWPISGRNIAKKTVRECIRCFRCKPRITQPILGNLPAERFHSGFPFQVTGIDYAGPISIKDRKGRGAKISKSWLCLFICFSTKAIHLELVTELSTESFLMAFRRFIARRGRPSDVFSDNGKNFVRAEKEISLLFKFLNDNEHRISESFANEGIKWHFIPAYSPHFGGLWEAGIKSSKHHLQRVMGNANLTYEELNTLITHVESILNSRPLHPMSHDPSDLLPLTPAHFLVGKTLTSLPDYNYTEANESRLNQFQRIQAIKCHFWNRWQKEYVSELQLRQKWKSNISQLQMGDLVLIKEDKVRPLDWRLGRVIQLHPGKDNVARVATVKTNRGEVKRAFAKLCPLPLPEPFESQAFQPRGHVCNPTIHRETALCTRPLDSTGGSECNEKK